MNRRLNTENMKRLFQAVVSLQNEEECARFFEDICTIKEVLDMAQRLDTAVMLRKGANYQTVSKEIGISTATISRVKKCLDYGSGGYALALDRLEESTAAGGDPAVLADNGNE